MRALTTTLFFLLLGLFATGTCAAANPSPSCPDPATAATHDGQHDFDFLLGDWNVHNRRLAKRLANSHDWTDFAATDSFVDLPGGLGTREHYATEFWPGYAALGLHLYDSMHHTWTLYWADNRNDPGTMQTLAKGAFVDGVGVFCAPDTFAGKPITVRILWTRVDDRHAHWEQAFSTDGGASWEINWTMDFARR